MSAPLITAITNNSIIGLGLLSTKLETPPINPICRFIYDETLGSNTIIDHSGNGNTLSVAGAESKYLGPFNDYSINVSSNGDGSYQKDNVVLSSIEDSRECSVSLWLYVDNWASITTTAYIFNKEISSNWPRGINIRYGSGNIVWEIESDEVNQYPTCSLDVIHILEKKWINLICTWNSGAIDSTDFKMYVDLVEKPFVFGVGAYSSSFELDEVSGLLSVGSSPGLTNNWVGGLYDILLYSRELTPSERAVIYNGGVVEITHNGMNITDKVSSWGDESISLENITISDGDSIEVNNNNGLSNVFELNLIDLSEDPNRTEITEITSQELGWIDNVQSWSNYYATIERIDLGYESDDSRFEYVSYKIQDLFGDERDFDYIRNNENGNIGIIRYSELFNPDIIASRYPEEDPFDIKAISELSRGYGIYNIDVLNINNNVPKRYVEMNGIRIVNGCLKYFELKVSRVLRGIFEIEFNNFKFQNQDKYWDAGEGDIERDEYQFKGNDYSLRSFPATGFADAGEGYVDSNEYRFTDNSFADHRDING